MQFLFWTLKNIVIYMGSPMSLTEKVLFSTKQIFKKNYRFLKNRYCVQRIFVKAILVLDNLIFTSSFKVINV